MSKTKWALGLVLALALAYLVASPWITVYRMKVAVEHRDGAALARHIDLPSVRQGLKDQINARVAGSIGQNRDVAGTPLATFGAALAGMMVDKLVDAAVTPTGISELLDGARPRLPLPGAESESDNRGADDAAPKPEPLAHAAMGYTAWDEFTVTARDRGGHDRKFILRRRGLGWKLADVVLSPH